MNDQSSLPTQPALPSLPARLLATLTAPLDPAEATRPGVRRLADTTLLVQGSDTELVTVTGDGEEVRFPAPWPRRFGTDAVAPARDLAVFAGVHALRAVAPDGTTRWEIRHGCWTGSCDVVHASYEEYAHSRDHLYPDSGSAVFSADGTLVWAHIRGPVAGSPEFPDSPDEWLVINAADGRILGRADAQTAAAGSDHVPHPDPAQMGLSVGEGQDGVPLRWGRWDGERLSVECLGDEERVLMAVSPSGDRLLTVAHYQEDLSLLRTGDGSVLATVAAESALPRHPATAEEHEEHEDPTDPKESEVHWDYEGGFLDEDTLIAGTAESDEEYGDVRHWLLDAHTLTVTGRIAYPFPPAGAPNALGDGTWTTSSPGNTASVHLWTLA
ncbi:hypothetical protein ACFXDJ_11095 [Streptomyces sp. NPDC059443]|uniref:hypothetical protein n=1 Tax=unclassified Streptomyces TaxID=2593676 RepID=UPI00368547C1